MAYRSFLAAGIQAAAGSDFSPGPFAPLMGIQGMVTRTGWNGETWGANQQITIDEALEVNTINGAYNSHEEGSRAPSRQESWRTSSCWPKTRTRWTKAKSKISRSCARSLVARWFHQA